jgi:hypothetical protein
MLMGYAYQDIIFCPTATGINQAVSAIGQMRCFNPIGSPTGVICNDFTKGNPISWIIPFYSGQLHPSTLYYGQP